MALRYLNDVGEKFVWTDRKESGDDNGANRVSKRVREKEGNSFWCEAYIKYASLLEARVVDLWTPEKEGARLGRSLCYIRGGSALRLHTEFERRDNRASSFDNYQFIFPNQDSRSGDRRCGSDATGLSGDPA